MQKTEPFISVITCTKNSERYLQKNITSVENQTFENYEHIFIDGFSSDNTIKIIKFYQKRNGGRVRLFQFPANGISNAFNRGILKTRGKWIVFLNGDDYFYNKKVLEKVYIFLKNKKEAEVLYGKAIFFKDENRKIKRVIPHRGIYKKARYWLLLLTNYIPHQTVFTRKTVFDKYGYFDEKLKSSMDYEMWIRLTKNKVNFYFLNQLISRFRVNEGSMGESDVAKSEHPKILKKYVKNKLIISPLLLVHKLNFLRKFI